MSTVSVQGVRIAGVVGCVPPTLVDNRQACADLFGEGVDTLIKATGIHTRAIASPGTTALDLEVAAAQRLLADTNTAPEEIGAVICVTFTPEHRMPCDAPSAQHRLGLPNEVIAFDISMACSGYGYGLYIAAGLVNTTGKKVLLLDGDVQSPAVSPGDKATVPVLADAGTATLLVPDPGSQPWYFSFYADGGPRDVLVIPAGGTRRPMEAADLEAIDYEDGSQRRDADIYMDGFAVFKFVAQTVSKFIKGFLDERGLSAADVDAFVPHQANMYMITQLAKKLKIDPAKLWTSGDVYGNPASASVPLTIAHQGAQGRDMDAPTTLMSGFGAGLSISVAQISLPSDAVYAVISYPKDDE